MEKAPGVEELTPAESLDRACEAYCDAQKLPFIDDEGQVDMASLKEFDRRLLDLVEAADNVASQKTSKGDRELAWVEPAKKGLRRLAKETPEAKGLEKSRMFSKKYPDFQRMAYEDMLARRDG